MFLLEKYLELQLNKNRLSKHLNKISTTRFEKRKKVPIASAIQREIIFIRRVEDYIDMLDRFVWKAAHEGSDLVAFPEYNFLDLIGILPGLNVLNKSLNALNLEENGGDYRKYTSLLLSIADPIKNAIETIMCNLAEKYGVYIYTGSYLIRENGKLYNCGSLISREGKILVTQKKLHLTDLETSLGFSRGSTLEVIETDIGRISCPICMDGTYFETFSLLRNMGCDIVILPIANAENYSLYKALRGAWLRAQESGMYIVKPSLNGNLAGMAFAGRAGVYGPLGVTEGTGTLNCAKQSVGSMMISAELDFDKLERWRETSEYFGDRNEAFECDYWNKTYGGK